MDLFIHTFIFVLETKSTGFEMYSKTTKKNKNSQGPFYLLIPYFLLGEHLSLLSVQH
jgi:hypothetical protein